MIGCMKLGYLVFEVSRLSRWIGFAEQVLGATRSDPNADGSIGLRLDEAAQRLILRQGRRDDLAAIGLELRDDDALDALAARLDAAGVQARPADEAVRAARRVRRLVTFADPDGARIEAFVGMAHGTAPFTSPKLPGGFKTGDLGMGHVVLLSRDIDAMERFYVDVLGFGVSERLSTRLGPLAVRGTFLHCNRRHHSLALFDLPLRRRLHHFMLEANEIRDVGLTFERAKAAKVPLSLGLGQHPDPDGTFSFYGATPSGFDFEIGAGGREIDPTLWRELKTERTSDWGHKPSLRLQLRMAGGLLAARLGMRSAPPPG